MTLRANRLNVDVDSALEKNSVGMFHYAMLLLCGVNFMSDALEVNLLSFLATCAGSEWNLSDTQQASITSVVFGGIIAGSMCWGSFADRYGRRLAFICAGSIIALGGFLTCLAPSFPYLLVFRGVVGFGIGGSNIAFDLLAEYLPPNNRGSLLILIEYFWTFGSMMVAVAVFVELWLAIPLGYFGYSGCFDRYFLHLLSSREPSLVFNSGQTRRSQESYRMDIPAKRSFADRSFRSGCQYCGRATVAR